MKTKVAIMALALAVAMPIVHGETPELPAVSGTIQIVGTKVKTQGGKSDKEVVVYLEKVDGQDYPAPPSEPALMDQQALVFVPHVLAIQKGTTVEFLNSDTTDHNVFCVDDCCKVVEDINAKKPKTLDLGNFPGGARAGFNFTIPGEAVILCRLHPEMAAYVLVLETPYFTVAAIDESTQSATFSIANVPPGKYTVKVWNKKTESAEQEITVGDDGLTDVAVELKRKQRKRKRR